MEAYEAIKGYYETYNEDARLTSRHGCVEFLTTVKYIEKYLTTGMKILEIGAGTGRYSHYFAQNGYEVDAVELVPHNIEIFKANTKPCEKINVYEGNATDLSFLSNEQYDITLVLGPMYHLFCEEDKISAIAEAIRVTKSGGIIFAAYCNNDSSIINFGFIKENIVPYIKKGEIDPITFKFASEPAEVFELYRKKDIDSLMSHFDVERLHYLGTDMATNFMRPTVDSMDDETFDIYLRYHFSICERPDMIGVTHHMLDVFRKG